MVATITPRYVPAPVGVLGWDGTNFHALTCDADGNLQLDPLLVGGDQLFSYKTSLLHVSKTTVVGASGYANSGPVPAGELWHVTHVTSVNYTKATTQHVYRVARGADNYVFHDITDAFAIGARSTFKCDLWLEEDDVVQIWLMGSNNGDTAWVYLLGSIMTKA